MRYQAALIVPANTLETDPSIERVKLQAGRLEKVLIRFKAGCHFRVYVTASIGLFQVVPANGSPALNGDNQVFEFPVQIDLDNPPYEITLQGWSEGTDFDHEITWWFDMVDIPPDYPSEFMAKVQDQG